MKKKNKSKIKNFLITFTIVGLALSFRIYNLEELFPFTMDEAYQGFIVEKIVSKKHFPLIGVNAAGTGLYLGPFFSYFAALVFLVSQKIILGWAVAAGLIGGLTTLCLIKVGQKLVGRVEGYLAGLLYAVSFLATSYDRKFWNPTLMPLLSILFVLSLTSIKREPKYWLLLFAILGLGFHTHFSILLFFPIALFWFLKERLFSKEEFKKDKWFKLGIAVFIFLLSPLILFEARQNFLQTKAFFSLFKNGLVLKSQTFTIKDKLLKLLQTSSRLIFIPGNHDISEEINVCQQAKKNAPFLGFGLTIPLSFVFLWKQKISGRKKKVLKIITSIFLVFVFSFLLFAFSPQEYYLLALFPLSCLILAWAAELIFLKKSNLAKALTLGFLIFVLGFNSWSSLNSKNSFGLKTKKQMILWVTKNIADRPYFLESIGNCYKYEGYRYLFGKTGQVPNASYVDNQLSWLYPEDKKPKKEYEKKVVIFSDTVDTADSEKKRWQEEFESAAQEKILTEFGKIKVLVLVKTK